MSDILHPVALNVRMDRDILMAVDAMAFDHRQSDEGGKAFSRSAVIKELLRDALVSRGRLPRNGQ